MGFGFQRDNALYVFCTEVVARALVFRGKLLNYRALRKGYVVLVCRQNLARVLGCCLLDHGKQRALHLLAVDDELP